MKIRRIILSLIFIFSLASASLFSQNIGEPTGNKFLDYMHGRNLFGINFGPTLYAGLFDIGVGIIEPTIQDTINDMTKGQANNYIDTKLKHYAFGLGFSYDFAPLNFMTVGLDIGFSVGQIKMDKYDISFNTVPWSLNVKFFFGKNAPFGFFLSPRIGGTALSVSGSALRESGISDIYSHPLELGLAAWACTVPRPSGYIAATSPPIPPCSVAALSSNFAWDGLYSWILGTNIIV